MWPNFRICYKIWRKLLQINLNINKIVAMKLRNFFIINLIINKVFWQWSITFRRLHVQNTLFLIQIDILQNKLLQRTVNMDDANAYNI